MLGEVTTSKLTVFDETNNKYTSSKGTSEMLLQKLVQLERAVLFCKVFYNLENTRQIRAVLLLPTCRHNDTLYQAREAANKALRKLAKGFPLLSIMQLDGHFAIN